MALVKPSKVIYIVQLLAWFLVHLWAVPVQGVPDSASLQYSEWHVLHTLPTTLFLHKGKKISHVDVSCAMPLNLRAREGLQVCIFYYYRHSHSPTR